MIKPVPSIVTMLGFTACLTLGTSAHADTIAYYDFEDETGNAITDKAGPDLSNATRHERFTSLESFNGSTGLVMKYNTNAAIDLGQGANDELAGDFADGLVVEATFQLSESAKGNPVLVSRNRLGDGRSWVLGLFDPNHTNENLKARVYFVVSQDGSVRDSVYTDPDMRIEPGRTYSVRATFDPAQTGSKRLQLTLTELESGDETTVTTSSSLSALYTSPDVSTYIGAQMSSSGSVTGIFTGTIDDVRISTVQP